jgi:hypothetical protein
MPATRHHHRDGQHALPLRAVHLAITQRAEPTLAAFDVRMAANARALGAPAA